MGLVLGKKKKAAVLVDEPRASRPIAFVLMLAASVGGCAILFNAFFNQPYAGEKFASVSGTTRVTVSAGEKASRTITLKYDALVEDVQRELLSTGHFSGLVDGVTGPKTKVAIETYQRENQLDITGNVSKSLLEHIQYTRKLNQAAKFTGSVTATDVDAPAAPKSLAIVAKPMVAPKVGANDSANGDKAIARLQQRLAQLGYDPGSRSGQLDEGTRSAILIFEMDHGLPMEGRISKPLLAAVKAAETKSPRKP